VTGAAFGPHCCSVTTVRDRANPVRGLRPPKWIRRGLTYRNRRLTVFAGVRRRALQFLRDAAKLKDPVYFISAVISCGEQLLRSVIALSPYPLTVTVGAAPSVGLSAGKDSLSTPAADSTFGGLSRFTRGYLQLFSDTTLTAMYDAARTALAASQARASLSPSSSSASAADAAAVAAANAGDAFVGLNGAIAAALELAEVQSGKALDDYAADKLYGCGRSRPESLLQNAHSRFRSAHSHCDAFERSKNTKAAQHPVFAHIYSQNTAGGMTDDNDDVAVFRDVAAHGHFVSAHGHSAHHSHAVFSDGEASFSWDYDAAAEDSESNSSTDSESASASASASASTSGSSSGSGSNSGSEGTDSGSGSGSGSGPNYQSDSASDFDFDSHTSSSRSTKRARLGGAAAVSRVKSCSEARQSRASIPYNIGDDDDANADYEDSNDGDDSDDSDDVDAGDRDVPSKRSRIASASARGKGKKAARSAGKGRGSGGPRGMKLPGNGIGGGPRRQPAQKRATAATTATAAAAAAASASAESDTDTADGAAAAAAHVAMTETPRGEGTDDEKEIIPEAKRPRVPLPSFVPAASASNRAISLPNHHSN